LAVMQYIETLARRIVADVAHATADRPIVWVQLEDIAQRIKVTLPAVETGAKAAVDWGWLSSEGSPPHAVCLTAAGRALVRRVGL
jgi:hypothetical protein